MFFLLTISPIIVEYPCPLPTYHKYEFMKNFPNVLLIVTIQISFAWTDRTISEFYY